MKVSENLFGKSAGSELIGVYQKLFRKSLSHRKKIFIAKVSPGCGRSKPFKTRGSKKGVKRERNVHYESELRAVHATLPILHYVLPGRVKGE